MGESRRLSNSLPIGGWHAVLSPERMKLEIVEGLQACVEGNAIQRYGDAAHKPSSNSEARLGARRRKSCTE